LGRNGNNNSVNHLVSSLRSLARTSPSSCLVTRTSYRPLRQIKNTPPGIPSRVRGFSLPRGREQTNLLFRDTDRALCRFCLSLSPSSTYYLYARAANSFPPSFPNERDRDRWTEKGGNSRWRISSIFDNLDRALAY